MTNGGFESGDASHWSFSGDAFTTGVDATSATIHAFIPSGSNIAAVDLDDFLLEGGLADSATATPTRLAVTKEGNGTLTLTGTSTHQLATAVKDGTLRLDGTFTSSAVIVDPGATLTGQGSLPAATIGGTLMLDAVRGPLAITGALVLADATLAITGSTAQAARILATRGSRAGSFARVTGVPIGYDLDLAYQGSAIALVCRPATSTAVSAWALRSPPQTVDFSASG